MDIFPPFARVNFGNHWNDLTMLGVRSLSFEIALSLEGEEKKENGGCGG